MKTFCKLLGFIGLQLLSLGTYAEQIGVSSLSYASDQNKTLIKFDVTASPKHRVFVMDNPSRLVVDIKNAILNHKLSQPVSNHPLFAKVRAASKDAGDLRVVVDLKKEISAKEFALSSNNQDENQLVIELIDKKSAHQGKVKVADAKIVSTKASEVKPEKSTDKTPLVKAAVVKEKTRIIAVDAGHGGNDPGAHGPHGTEEKMVTFAIAQKLAGFINAQPGMKAIMVRNGDYYVGLRERMNVARVAKADLFISIHADAYQDASVRGASVYTLSTSGASSEAARWLEKSENAAEADLVSGVSLGDKDEVLASVLLDLSQTATQQASVNLANCVLKHFDNISELHKDAVQKAGFIVLKSPDIPSILVETAFISNSAEEQNLLSTRYQGKMANAIFKGVLSYFNKYAPDSNRMAAL